MRTAFRIAYFGLAASGITLVGATTLVGCSSSDAPGGTPATGGSSGSGTGGKGGSTAASGGSGGTSGTGTAGTGAAGSGGAAGNSSSAGSGGAAGAACVGDPPVTPNKTCATIPAPTKGTGFTVSSMDFPFCGEIPASMTCDGHDFGTGASPRFKWEGAPAGTQSFAIVFKDISLSNDVATERFGYHWAMWDVPAGTTALPPGMTGGYASAEVPGAHQWSSLTSYGFFTPCPNPFPRGAPQFMCSLTQDSYSLTVYALSVAKLDNLPPPVDTATGMPASTGWNWIVNMGHYIESLDTKILAIAEYRGTSKAWAANFVPPAAAAFPCTSANSGGTGGTGGAGGTGGSSGSGGKGGSGGSSGSGGKGGSGGSGGASGGSGGASGGSGGTATMCLQ